MIYFEKISKLIKNVPSSLVDITIERTPARIPTQVSSNFITNKQQGDWAENLIFQAINKTSKNHVAVRYGKSDDLIAGDTNFKNFFQEFQNELDTIGKRPDLLIFDKSDFKDNLGYDISKLPHSEITDYVKKAIAGLEIRSSAFLIEKYEQTMNQRTKDNIEIALNIRDVILNNYIDLLENKNRSKYITILESINKQTIQAISFKVPGWRSSERLVEINTLFKELKNTLTAIQKRDFLSITVKNEDLQVVYKWIETFNVPHFYIQVFFDKVLGISYENILKTLSDPDKEDIDFYTERNKKNQDKPTIHISSKIGLKIADRVIEPTHKSVRKEMARGRLLFYVAFNGGQACLDVEKLIQMLEITKDQF